MAVARVGQRSWTSLRGGHCWLPVRCSSFSPSSWTTMIAFHTEASKARNVFTALSAKTCDTDMASGNLVASERILDLTEHVCHVVVREHGNAER